MNRVGVSPENGRDQRGVAILVVAIEDGSVVSDSTEKLREKVGVVVSGSEVEYATAWGGAPLEWVEYVGRRMVRFMARW